MRRPEQWLTFPGSQSGFEAASSFSSFFEFSSVAIRDIFGTVVFHFLSFSFRTRRKHPPDTLPKLSQVSVKLRGKKENLCQKIKSDVYRSKRHLTVVITPIKIQIHKRVVKRAAFMGSSQIQVNGG